MPGVDVVKGAGWKALGASCGDEFRQLAPSAFQLAPSQPKGGCHAKT